eukprot:TRINITY_DN770_c0_g1_i1.p1 TRINITY_DN770_c0_g1~~TRINITY_DN770_c0_g1_i1.p1  ORF type:complete len:121 (+),score=22.14 TRINITY_DN770_c0_g1_i1:369-731(+)
MKKWQKTFDEVLKFVQNIREVVQPNSTFMKQLQMYSDGGYSTNQITVMLDEMKINHLFEIECKVQALVESYENGCNPDKLAREAQQIMYKLGACSGSDEAKSIRKRIVLALQHLLDKCLL